MLWRKTFIHLISSISKRKKLSVSMRNQTSDLLIPGFKPLSLNQRGSLTRILHTATISNVENVICVNRQEKFTLFFITFGTQNSPSFLFERLFDVLSQPWKERCAALTNGQFKTNPFTQLPCLWRRIVVC